MAVIEVFKENGITPFAGPIAQSHYLIEHFILSEAGVDGHKDVLAGDVPESWVKGLTHIKELYDLGAFSADALSMEIEASQILFRQEKAAMILEGSWFIGGCDDALKAKLTVLPMPAAPGGAKDPSSIVAGYSSGYYISRSSYEDAQKQQAVVDLVTYLTTAEAVKQIATANGGTPSVSVTVEGLPQVALDGHKMAAAASGLTMPIDSRLTPEAFNYIVKEGVPFIAFGERTAQEVLDEVKKIQNR
jgi:raffinose/stachyose/melibiose transport system substrate-binding protein